MTFFNEILIFLPTVHAFDVKFFFAEKKKPVKSECMHECLSEVETVQLDVAIDITTQCVFS